MAKLPASLPFTFSDDVDGITERPPCRLSRDPERYYRDRSEFGFGPGLVAPGLESMPIREGGVYRAKCPPVELIPSENLSVRVRQTRWRRGDPPRGYAGERVG